MNIMQFSQTLFIEYTLLRQIKSQHVLLSMLFKLHLRIHDNDNNIIVLPTSEFFLINISYC